MCRNEITQYLIKLSDNFNFFTHKNLGIEKDRRLKNWLQN